MAQYPFERRQRFATESVRFLDGSQQRYRLLGACLRRWVIALNTLDEQELGAVIDFVEVQGDSAFAFVDPVSGDTAPRCAIAAEEFEAVLNAELRGKTSLVIEELP